MKKASRQKTKQTPPTTSLKNNSSEEIPALLKYLNGKSEAEAINGLFQPRNEQGRKMIGGIFSAFLNTGVTVPEWVTRASQKLFEGFGLNSVQEALANPADNSDFSRAWGKIIGLVEKVLQKPAPLNSKMGEAENKPSIVEYFKLEAIKEKPEEAAAFFNGRNEAGKLVEFMENPSQRTKIYIIIACFWEKIEKFKSTAEFHQWLLSLKGAGGRSLIVPSTDSREIRKICKTIGLKFQNKWQKA